MAAVGSPLVLVSTLAALISVVPLEMRTSGHLIADEWLVLKVLVVLERKLLSSYQGRVHSCV